MRIFSILLCLFFNINSFAANYSADSLYETESFSFKADSGRLTLNGSLTIPKTFKPDGKLVILVRPPQPGDRNYFGMFSTIADLLGKKGIAVLRFDNRAFVNKLLGEDGANMFDQSADLHDAYVALKNDKRFSKTQIGLLGHSEGGNSVAIEASKNKEVSFVILLSTSGIAGEDLVYRKFVDKLNATFFAMKEEKKKIIFSEFREQVEIVARNNNIDSIKTRFAEFTMIRYKRDPKYIGKQTLQKVYDDWYKRWLTRRRIAFVQYNPILYYSKLKCPALVMFGSFDELLDYKENMNGIKRIFDSVNKKNYDIVVIDSLNHTYQQVNARVIKTHHQNNTQALSKDFSQKTFDIIVTWIKVLKP